MAESNSIRKLIKILFSQCKTLVIDQGLFYFINLIALHSIIMLSIILMSEWINNNINIFDLSVPMILLRISLFGLFLGVWIGYFKILFNYIDKQSFALFNVFKNYHLLPKIFILKLISYLTILPLVIFVVYKFPYDINVYGSNIQLFIADLGDSFATTYTDEISWGIYSSYLGLFDLIIFMLLSALPIWYSLRFWCAELLIIDRGLNIKDSLITSYALTHNLIQLIILGCLLIFINLLFTILGYLFFIIGLTFSYICIFLYYRYLKTSILNHTVNK